LVYFPNDRVINCVNELNYNIDRWKNIIPLLNENCNNCIAIGICGGGCLYDSAKYRNETGFDGRHCSIVKRVVEEFLWYIFENDGMNANNVDFLILKYNKTIEFGQKDTKFSVGH
jgi:sulfatase maturation enzyme AslB (radical SAM superfamily)